MECLFLKVCIVKNNSIVVVKAPSFSGIAMNECIPEPRTVLSRPNKKSKCYFLMSAFRSPYYKTVDMFYTQEDKVYCAKITLYGNFCNLEIHQFTYELLIEYISGKIIQDVI